MLYRTALCSTSVFQVHIRTCISRNIYSSEFLKLKITCLNDICSSCFKLYGECGSSFSDTFQNWGHPEEDKERRNFQIVKRTKKETGLYREGYWALSLLSRVCESRNSSLGAVVIHGLPQSPGSADRVPLMLLSYVVISLDFHFTLFLSPTATYCKCAWY